MGGLQGAGDLDADRGHRPCGRSGPSRRSLLRQRLAAQLQDEHRTAVGGGERPVEGDDIRMVAHLGQRLDLPGEGLDETGVDGVDLQDLRARPAGRVDLDGPIHGGEGSAADLDGVPVARQDLGRRRGILPSTPPALERYAAPRTRRQRDRGSAAAVDGRPAGPTRPPAGPGPAGGDPGCHGRCAASSAASPRPVRRRRRSGGRVTENMARSATAPTSSTGPARSGPKTWPAALGDLSGGVGRAGRHAGLLQAVEQLQPGAHRQLDGLGAAAGAAPQEPASAGQSRPEQGGRDQRAAEHGQGHHPRAAGGDRPAPGPTPAWPRRERR